MTSAEEAPRDAIPSAREKDAPAEGEEGWDSREGETEESRGGGDPTQKKDLLDILALAAAAEQVEEGWLSMSGPVPRLLKRPRANTKSA